MRTMRRIRRGLTGSRFFSTETIHLPKLLILLAARGQECPRHTGLAHKQCANLRASDTSTSGPPVWNLLRESALGLPAGLIKTATGFSIHPKWTERKFIL